MLNANENKKGENTTQSIEISLNNFRNISQETLKISSCLCFVSGANASGKTSLLEAIYFLAFGKSFRCSNYRKIINFAAENFVVHAKIKVSQNNSKEISLDPYLNINALINKKTSQTKSNFGEFNTTDSDIKTVVAEGLCATGSSFVDNNSYTRSIGLFRSRSGETQLRVDNQNVTSFLDLAKHFPVQLLNNDSYLLLEGEPAYRRKFLDWILFHVEPCFVEIWQNFKRVLMQRNSVLKESIVGVGLDEHLSFWDREFCRYAALIQRYRINIVLLLQAKLNALLGDNKLDLASIASINFILKYRAAFESEEDLLCRLKAARDTDLKLKTTTVGPHREDLSISANGVPVKFLLSRGQTKLLVFALNIARELLLRDGLHNKNGSNNTINSKSIFLIDDLRAEFDANAFNLVLELLKELNIQAIVTGVEPLSQDVAAKFNAQMFHVERGAFREVPPGSSAYI